MINAGDFLVSTARKYPEKTAIVFREQRISYRELNLRVNRLAHHLLDMGVRKGDRVGFMLYNSNQFLEIVYACFKIGAVAVPLNFRLHPREVKWCLDNVGCKVFAYGAACAGQVNPVKQEFSTVEQIIYSGPEAPGGEHHFETLTSAGSEEEPKVRVEPDDPAYCIFTGGTTGVMKAPVHTHRSAFFGVMAALVTGRITVDEVLATSIPYFHIGGFAHTRALPAVGGTIVLVETFDPQEILKVIERERATWLTLLPPTILTRLIDVPNFKDYDLSSVKKISTSAGAFPKQVMLRVLDVFPNANIFYGWGMTENNATGGTQGVITREMIEQDLPQVKSIGREAFLSEIKLVDEEGKEVPLGEVGEAVVRFPGNMVGYYGQPELTAETIKDGWLHTGDLMKKDEKGYYYFVGRKKDMIKTGGENVFAEEVEKVILTHPAVEMCAVIGLPDEKWGEAVTAVVKLRQGKTATEEEIIDHCKQVLASYKKPQKIIFVEQFPVTDAGKIRKYMLVQQFSEELGLRS